MVGEPGGGTGVVGVTVAAQGECGAAVQLDPFPRQQVRRHDLGQETVPQQVALAAVVHPHGTVHHRLAHRREQGRRFEVEDVGEQPVPQRSDTGRQRPDDLLRGGREQRDPAQHDLAQRARQPVGVTAEHGPDGLLGDERVARRALPDQGRELGPVRRPVGHQRRQHVAWQGRHVEGRHLAQATQLGERDVEVGGAARAVGPERDEHQHRLADEVGDEVGDEIAGRPVGPLQVVDHEEHRAPFGEVDDQLVQQVEEHDGRPGVGACTAACGRRVSHCRSSVATSVSGSARAALRIADSTGQNGGASVMSTALPVRTTAPARRAWRASSSTSLVLPTPPSPATSTAAARPERAAPKAPVSTASSRARPRSRETFSSPTRGRLTRLPVRPPWPGR